MSRQLQRSEWAEVLNDLTERNASRLTRIEVDHPDIGAQEQERNYPLRGMAYDPGDDRIEIMLGHLGRAEPHLTHTISGATELEILTGAGGEDEVVRVVHGGGQTLLRFMPD